eukprot:7692720-Pyramimonas_sp.AAC.1
MVRDSTSAPGRGYSTSILGGNGVNISSLQVKSRRGIAKESTIFLLQGDSGKHFAEDWVPKFTAPPRNLQVTDGTYGRQPVPVTSSSKHPPRQSRVRVKSAGPQTSIRVPHVPHASHANSQCEQLEEEPLEYRSKSKQEVTSNLPEAAAQTQVAPFAHIQNVDQVDVPNARVPNMRFPARPIAPSFANRFYSREGSVSVPVAETPVTRELELYELGLKDPRQRINPPNSTPETSLFLNQVVKTEDRPKHTWREEVPHTAALGGPVRADRLKHRQNAVSSLGSLTVLSSHIGANGDRRGPSAGNSGGVWEAVSYTHLRAHETGAYL